jgi:Rrf2 family protein
MKISSKVECGIIALIDIDINSRNGSAVTVSSISARQNISAKYLEQILPALKQANLIRALKGSRGGYIIARPSDTITFREIIDALDITVLNETVVDDSDNSSIIKSTVSSCLWSKMNSYLREFTESITLSDVINCYNDTVNSNSAEPMYYI